MPIIKIDTGRSSTKVGRYLSLDRKGEERYESFVTNTGAENVKEAELQFRATREANGKTEGRQFFQAYISFQRDDLGSLANPDGSPNWERIAAYGKEWAERAGVAQRHEFYVVAHGDKPHPHIHVVWNATSHEDGRKYQFNGRPDMERARDINDQLARDNGIKRQLDRHRDPERAPDKVLREAQRGAENYSWKMDLQNRIKGIASHSVDEQRFIRDLARLGVEVRTRGQGYSYSFEDASGMKRVIRGSRLGEPYRRDAILERLCSHREMLLKGGDPEPFARNIRSEKKDFQSRKTELRQSIQQAKRRAAGEEQFRAKLESKGVRLESGQDKSYRYSFTDRLGFRHDGVPDSSLGAAYRQEHLQRDFQENAIRKMATADIAWASRGAGTEAEFASRLAQRGISLSKEGDRYKYALDTPLGSRSFEGEALSRHVTTQAVSLRFAENAGLREIHQKVASARCLAGDSQEYLSRLQARGIDIHRDEAGRAFLRYHGASHDAAQFTRTPLDEATFRGGTRASRAMVSALEGIAQRISRDARAASREDYYDGPDLVRSRERHGRLRPAMDTESVNEGF
jgi:hypothetical protein